MPAPDLYRLPAWAAWLLRPLSAAYAAAAARDLRRKLARQRRLDRPVVSVGNLTVGGTGKTPVTAFLAERLRDRGYLVVILTRGYGAPPPAGGVAMVSNGEKVLLDASAAGDEPLLLARRLSGVAVVRGADRWAAGNWYARDHRVDMFLLDDGFQHARLHRDFDLLLLDGRRGVGNGLVLPAGPLRERPAAAARADGVLVTRCAAPDPLAALPEALRPWLAGKPAWAADFALKGIFEPGRNEAIPPAEVGAAVALAGLADPEQFFGFLEKQGIPPRARLPFPDHHRYRPQDAETVRRAVAAAGARRVLVTAKDAVKLDGLDFGAPLGVVEIGLSPEPDGLVQRILTLL